MKAETTIVACISLSREAAFDLHRELAEQLGIVKIMPRVAQPAMRLTAAEKVERIVEALSSGPRSYGEIMAITGLDNNSLYGTLCRNRSKARFKKCDGLWRALPVTP